MFLIFLRGFFFNFKFFASSICEALDPMVEKQPQT